MEMILKQIVEASKISKFQDETSPKKRKCRTGNITRAFPGPQQFTGNENVLPIKRVT